MWYKIVHILSTLKRVDETEKGIKLVQEGDSSVTYFYFLIMKSFVLEIVCFSSTLVKQKAYRFKIIQTDVDAI